jgi:hypothetical protein
MKMPQFSISFFRPDISPGHSRFAAHQNYYRTVIDYTGHTLGIFSIIIYYGISHFSLKVTRFSPPNAGYRIY